MMRAARTIGSTVECGADPCPPLPRTVMSTESEYVAQTHTELAETQANEVMELVAALDSDDDVQNVYSNLG